MAKLKAEGYSISDAFDLLLELSHEFLEADMLYSDCDYKCESLKDDRDSTRDRLARFVSSVKLS